MNTVIINIRDLLLTCRNRKLAVDNLEGCICRYIWERYSVPVAYTVNFPAPVNIPSDDLISPYIEGNITDILNVVDQDHVIEVMIRGDYLLILR